MGLYMNGECNATNVQGKNYNLHKLQGGGARAPVPHSCPVLQMRLDHDRIELFH